MIPCRTGQNLTIASGESRLKLTFKLHKKQKKRDKVQQTKQTELIHFQSVYSAYLVHLHVKNQHSTGQVVAPVILCKQKTETDLDLNEDYFQKRYKTYNIKDVQN